MEATSDNVRTDSRMRWWAIVIGVGLALSPIHNYWLAKWTTSSEGTTAITLPALGYVLLIVGTGFFLLNYWDKVRALGWGDKKLLTMLVVLVIAISLSGIVSGGAPPFLFAVCMLGLYFAARTIASEGLGRWFVLPALIVGGIAVLTTLVTAIVAPEHRDYGLITNYCALAGFLVLSGLLVDRRWLWAIFGIVVLAVILTGALEGLFILGVLCVFMMVRRDWGKRMLAPLGAVALVAVILLLVGVLPTVFQHTKKNIDAVIALVTGQVMEDGKRVEDTIDEALTGRWVVIKDAVSDIRWLGHGFIVTPAHAEVDYTLSSALEETDSRQVHNMPLAAVDQVGPIGGLAWLAATVYCAVKTKWKYVWATVLAAGVFDYYMWTQLAPYWWMFAGMSTVAVDKDYIFRR